VLKSTVLIVEDDVDTGNMLVASLDRAGFNVRSVPDRSVALREIRSVIYNFIVMDVSMPGMTLTEFMTKASVFRTTNIILISAVVDPCRTAYALGLKYWLRKPFSGDELSKLIGVISSEVSSTQCIEHPDVVPGNVLVVEDDEDSGGLISAILTHAGYGVRWVKSRDAAIVAMQRYIYELILLDYAMPGLGIEDFLKVCAAMTEKIVLLSAAVNPEAEARRLGLKHWIKKPYAPEELVATLREFRSSAGIRPKI
jgi:DNA-binding response OmpR family regulator